MKFGIEIEAKGLTETEVQELLVANGIPCRREGYTHRVMAEWKVLYDASVSGGFELVGPPMEYNDANVEEVRKVLELLNEAGADVDRRCGIHVHFDVSGLSPQHIANIYNRYRKYETKIDSFMPRSRRASNNSYCASLTSQQELVAQADARTTCAARPHRYYKVNLSSFIKYGTIEFRQHAGSLNRAKVANWIHFLKQFIDASKPAPTQAVATGNVRGNSVRIVELLATSHTGLTATYLAETLGMTRASVQSAICRLRRNHGYHISTGNRYRLMARPTQQATSAPVENESFWKGITNNLQTYFTRRATILAA